EGVVELVDGDADLGLTAGAAAAAAAALTAGQDRCQDGDGRHHEVELAHAETPLFFDRPARFEGRVASPRCVCLFIRETGGESRSWHRGPYDVPGRAANVRASRARLPP